MEKYLGVRIVEAELCSMDQFAGAKNKNDLSKLSGGVDQDGYKVVYEDGYVSWLPKEELEKSYRSINGLTFGLAIEALKQGKCVKRKAWANRKLKVMTNKNISIHTEREYIDLELPWIGISMMSSIVDLSQWSPYKPTNIDMLAEDWMIIE